jgi:hypothetical protein
LGDSAKNRKLVGLGAVVFSRCFDLDEAIAIPAFGAGSFHLWLEYSLNVPLFQWGILSAYVLFIDPKDVRHAIEWMRLRKLNRVSVE